MLRSFAIFVATGALSGYFPFAPGTVGSVVGLVLYAGVRSSGGRVLEAATIVVVALVGCWASFEAERHFGREDPGQVVVDEVLGMLVTVAFVPVTISGAVVAFLLFRVLDILKPYPARQFESFPGGWGIMADDAMAGVYGNVLMRVAALAVPGLVASS